MTEDLPEDLVARTHRERRERSPSTEVDDLIARLAEWLLRYGLVTEATDARSLLQALYQPLVVDPRAIPELPLKTLFRALAAGYRTLGETATGSPKEMALMLSSLLMKCAYATRASARGDADIAWTFIVDAVGWSYDMTSFSGAIMQVRAGRRLSKKLTAESLNDRKHAGSREMRDQVRKRFVGEKGKFGSKDEAALAYTKDYAAEFSTIRGWLKNL